MSVDLQAEIASSTAGLPKVCLDTNVILAGSLRPQGAARHLMGLRDKCLFVIPDGAVAEANQKILSSTRDVPDEVVRVLVDGFCRDLGALTVTGFPIAPHDSHIKRAAIEMGCDFVCTYDKDDFVGFEIPTWSPVPLVKHFHPDKFLVESTWLDKCGTYMLTMLAWGGDEGRLLRDDLTQSAICVHSDGSVHAEGSSFTGWRTNGRISDGKRVALIVRYNKEEVRVEEWSHSDDSSIRRGLNERVKPSKVQLASGTIRLKGSPIPGVIRHSEVYNVSSVPIWVGDASLARGILNGSLEVVFGKPRSMEQLLKGLHLRWSPAGVEVSWRG